MKKKHKEQQEPGGYKCIHCDLSYNELFQVRQHMTKKHREVPASKISCEQCGLIVRDANELRIHNERHCHQNSKRKGFQEIRSKYCHFFLKGKCLKGDHCKFFHDESKRSLSRNVPKFIPKCRNGIRCSYLLQGVCRFFHSTNRSQGTHTEVPYMKQHGLEPKQWCKFLEDCLRVPNCNFKHYEEVFQNFQV